MIEKIRIKCVRKFSKLDPLKICFLVCMFIFVPITIVKHILNNNDFGYVVLIPIFFLFATIETIKQNNNYKKEGKELFGNTYENKFNSNIEALKSIIISAFTPFIILVTFFFIFWIISQTTEIITPKFDQVANQNKIENWGEFGDYIGGVFGTILTFLTFAITLLMLSSQQKQIKMARQEFRQQQFETTTFANKLNDIKEHISKIEKDNKVTKQFYQLLQMTFKEIQEYSNDKIIIKKHADMLKMSLTDDILIKIFQDKNIPNDSKKDNDDLFVNIRNIINKYALFRNLKLPCNQYNNDCYKKYKISAFENNIELMTYRISLETNAEELDKDEYVENPNVLVRQAVAANPNTHEKTLTFLSIDKSKEVRQAVASNPNTPKNILTQLATNDLSDEVRICALGNSNIDKKLLERELKDKYYEIDEHNIEKMAKIIFNNSQIYNDNTKFNKYMMKIISYLEKKYDNEEYDLRNDKKEKIFKYFEKELNDNIYKNIISLSIDNILNYKCPHTCYHIIKNNTIIQKIYSYDNNIWQIISNNIIDKIKNQESTARITSVFKEHEKELRKFISQLKNK